MLSINSKVYFVVNRFIIRETNKNKIKYTENKTINILQKQKQCKEMNRKRKDIQTIFVKQRTRDFQRHDSNHKYAASPQS